MPLDLRQAVLVSERHGMRTAVDVELRQILWMCPPTVFGLIKSCSAI